MKISKQLAEDLAKMLTLKKDKAIEKAKKGLTDFAEKIYLKSIPKEVMAMFEKYPSYIKKTNYLYISGKGLNHESVYLSKSFPSKESVAFQPTEKECDNFRRLIDNSENLRNKKRELINQTEAALITLSTSKRVSEQFPELMDYLNKLDNGKLTPVANIEELKKELKSN